MPGKKDAATTVDRHGDPLRLFVAPSALRIPAGVPRREAPRPLELREADYDEKYDDDTLYYDVFRAGQRVVAIGPPLLNVGRHVRDWRYATDVGLVATPRVTTLNRTHRATFARVAPLASTMTVTGPRGDSQTVAIGEDFASCFAGTRALVTLQLNNDLDWIRDWVRWHHFAHGTDAVLLYDNGSTRYSMDELADAISIPGIRVCAVVAWRFKYGPQGSDTAPWDSDFAQYSAIEHARWRFLRDAAGVLSIDIDELVHCADGRSVYDHATESKRGFATFAGVWAYSRPTTPPAHPHHSDCQWIRGADPSAAIKWCAVPSRLPDSAQMIVHGIHAVEVPTSPLVSFWHMRPISTHWKRDRSRSAHDPASFTHNAVIEQQLARYLNTAPSVASSSAGTVTVPKTRQSATKAARLADLLRKWEFSARCRSDLQLRSLKRRLERR